MIVDLTMIQVPMMIVITDIHSHKYPSLDYLNQQNTSRQWMK